MWLFDVQLCCVVLVQIWVGVVLVLGCIGFYFKEFYNVFCINVLIVGLCGRVWLWFVGF